MRRPDGERRGIVHCAARAAWVCALIAAPAGFAADLPIDNPAGRVLLNDSFEARDELERINLLVQRKQWPDVVRRCQALIDEQGDTLVEREDGMYVSVAAEVEARLADMPTAAVRAYRAEFESVARAAAGASPETRDVGLMLRFVDDYFCTQTAGRVAERAAEMLCEDGRFDHAADLMQRLLDHHPDFVSRPPEKVARLGIMLAWAGRLEQATAALDELRERAPATMVRWGRQTLPATEVLVEQIERVRRGAPSATKFAWPVLGGDLTRTRVIESDADAGAALWRYPLDAEVTTEEHPSHELEDAEMRPLIVDDVIYFQDATRAWAVDAATGRLRWRFDGGPADRGATEGYGERTAPQLHVPAVDHGAVYVVLGEPTTSYFGSSAEQSRVALVRLDGAGQPVWRLGAEAFGHAYARVHLDPAPIADGDHVFVTVRRQKTSGFEDCFLARIDAADGSIDWQTHLSSAAIGGYGLRVPTLSIAAKLGDVVYVCTNLGSIAAVDAWTGRIRWLRAYSRVDPGDGTLLSREALPEQSRDYQPIFCVNDMIVALPTDSTSLLVLDPADGTIIGDVPRSTLADPVTLLGMFDDKLFALGKELVCWDLREGKSLWTRPRPDGPLRGRPALTRSAVYWPCASGIVRWDLDGPTHSRTNWDDPALAGNLLATPDQLIVLSDTNLSLLERKSSAIARLRGRIAAAPDDPQPRLDLAEVTLRTGDVGIGAAALREVVERLADPASAAVVADPELRQRVHDACMMYGERSRQAANNSLTDAIYWLRAAGRYAMSPHEQIAYRMALADALAAAADPVAAIGVYRQIIVDRSLCDSSDAPPDGQKLTAGEIASDRIAALIQTRGREVYKSFEREASSALSVAVQRENLEALDAIVVAYPNSKAAARALLASGELLSRQGDPMGAARRYYRALTRFPERIDQPSTVLRLASCYRTAQRPEAALAWVAKGARLYPGARVRIADGSETTFDELARRWRAALAVRPALGPTVIPPLHEAADIPLAVTAELLEPTLDRRSDGKRGAFLTYADQAVTCRLAVTGEPVWPQPAPCRVRPILLKLDDERAIFATRHQVFALRLSDGMREWAYGKYPADVDDADTDPEWFDVFERHVITDDVLVSIKSNDEAVRLDPATGAALWSAVLPGRPRGGVALDDHLFAFVEVVGEVGFDSDRSLLWLVDAATGELRSRIELAHRDAVPSNGLCFTADGTLLLATTRRLEVFETTTGQRLWEILAERTLQTDTLSVGVDGIYIADRKGRLVKRSLIDGRPLWTRELGDPQEHSASAMTLQLSGATLVASTARQLVVLDANDGRVVREVALPNDRDSTFVYGAVTPDAVLSVVSDEERPDAAAAPTAHLTARFLPRADRTGDAPGTEPTDLGRITPPPDAFLLTDHALIVMQNGHAHRWVDATAPATP